MVLGGRDGSIKQAEKITGNLEARHTNADDESRGARRRGVVLFSLELNNFVHLKHGWNRLREQMPRTPQVLKGTCCE